MREIKLEVMFYVFNQSMVKEIKKHYTTVDRLCKSNEFFKQDVEVLCKRQYTGLKDKKGVEIYEGDIVKSLGESDYRFGVRLVEFVDAKFTIRGYGLISELVEIIGNIYENPELLEQQ